MTHDDNPVPPADAATHQPDQVIDPTPQADAPAVAPSPVDTLPFEEPADAASPATDLPPPPITPDEPFPLPPSPTSPDEPLLLSPSPAPPREPLLLSPSPGTPGEGRGEGSAQLALDDPTDSHLTEPAPADLAAIAAVASLSTTDANSDAADTAELDHEEDHEEEEEDDEMPTTTTTTTTARPRRVLAGGWTMGLLLSGIAIIAACVLIPQGDETRKLMYEREKLRADLEQVQKQVATNEQFLQKVQSDPTLAARLAQRQMKLVPAGTKVLDLGDASPTKDDKSPFLITSVPPPAPMPPYHPRGGWFAQMCRNGRSQLYMIGGGLLLVAAGLVLGVSGTRD